MTTSLYDQDLDRNPANFQPLTPLTLLERAAEVFPDRLAIVHGALRRTYREFYTRSRRLASALAACSAKGCEGSNRMRRGLPAASGSASQRPVLGSCSTIW